jgi:hypothetical protein
MRSFIASLSIVITALVPAVCFGQGTLQITFDGPPNQPPGSDFLVQSYFESGMYFQPIPGTDGFGRAWSGQPAGIPEDGTPYIVTGAGETLAFSFTSASEFGLTSVELAGFSIGAPDYTVTFVGYHSDGSTVQASFSGSGIQFQTYNFGSDWSSGLTKVELPDSDWSLDNLVVAVPEPSANALLIIGFIISRFCRKKLAAGRPTSPRLRRAGRRSGSNRDVGENFYVGTQL